jgi:FMN phosphatase YigB (HAD superfamily)
VSRVSDPTDGVSLEAVTFDFWNTLIRQDDDARHHRIDAWVGLLEDAGFACERERIDAVYASAWDAFQRSWHANEQFLAAHAAEALLEALDFDVPADVRRELVDTFGPVGARSEVEPTDGVGDCLRALRDAGLRLGIVCDVGFTPSTILRQFLDRHGLLDLFDHWSFSDEVGHYKPSPVIFEHALAGLGDVAPQRVAHVGDIRRTDVAGALSMGMVAVRYRGVSDDDNADHPEGHHVVDHHAEVPEVLGVGQIGRAR